MFPAGFTPNLTGASGQECEPETLEVGKSLERRIEALVGRMRWKLSQDIRAYVREAARASEIMSDDLSWALEHADNLDPLVGEPDANERGS